MYFVHTISPIAVSLGFFDIKWYGISYVLGLLVTWAGIRRMAARDYPRVPLTNLDDLFSWMVIGLLLGGRLGYAAFYEPQIFLQPLDLLKVWEGGMSFHGAVLGIAIAGIYSSRRVGFSTRYIADRIALFAPFGIFLGRIANFINSEHVGYPTDLPWAVVFPLIDNVPRHPSQLYEALFEGLFLWALLGVLYYFYELDKRQKGGLFGVFLLGYAVARWVCEYYRMPDGYFLGLTYGQFLSIPLAIAGLLFLLRGQTEKRQVKSA